MPKPILVGLDPGRGDVAPLRLGAALARITGAPLMVLAAYLHDPITHAVSVELVEHDLRTDALQKLEALTAGTDADLLVVGGPSPARALHDAAVRLDARLLVVGSTAKGPVGRVVPGSTAERLLHGAPCPVAVAPKGLGADWRPRRVGAGFIDAPDSRLALRAAAELAHAAGGTLHAITAVDPIEWSQSAATAPDRADGRLDTSKAVALRGLDDAVGRLPMEIAATTEVVVARPDDALTALSEHVDLLVCGSRGYGPLRASLIGGVTRRVIRTAQCPMVIVHRGAEESIGTLVEGREATAR